MDIEGFDEILNILYIAKKLYDMDMYGLVEESFYDVLCFDAYYENMYGLLENIFEYHDFRYSDRYGMEIHVMSDPVVVDFCILAGEYGKIHNVSDERNPYIQEAVREIKGNLNFSYCIDWKFMVHTEPRRPFHSRLGIFVYQDDYVDPGWLAYGLVEIYGWFLDACTRLKGILQKNKSDVTQMPVEGVMAA